MRESLIDVLEVVGVITLLCLGVWLSLDPSHSGEYNSGYKAGYTEHNVTRYDVAVTVVAARVSCFSGEADFDYAMGYKAGYSQYEEEKSIRVLRGDE